MKIRTPVAFLAVIFLFFSFSGISRGSSHADDLFQQALVKESGERNLEGAIELYKQVIEDPSAERLIQFEARIRMGNCYERLGRLAEAEVVYQKIVDDAATPQSEFAQQAQTNLHRVQVQQKLIREGTGTLKPETMVTAEREFHPSRFALALGPSFLRSGDQSLGKLTVAARCRLTESNPYPVYVELGSVTPIGGSGFTDTVELKYQTSLVVIKEAPHGVQRTAIPELGAGLAWTQSQQNTTSPHFVLGVRFYADKRVSLLVQGTYTANPYRQSPDSLWGITGGLQIKIGRTKIVVRPKDKS